MLSLSHAFVKPHASPNRLRALVAELKRHGCAIPMAQEEGRIDFDVAECKLWWIASGGIRELFAQYRDVVAWTPAYFENASDTPPFPQA